MKYAFSLKFEQEPNYKILNNFFENIVKRNGNSFDKYVLSWGVKEKLTLSRKSSNQKSERKSTSRKRLYRKIQKSIEKKNLFLILI